jgi:hypothetical protein
MVVAAVHCAPRKVVMVVTAVHFALRNVVMLVAKTRVIPVLNGATGTISKSFRKYVSIIPGNHEAK